MNLKREWLEELEEKIISLANESFSSLDKLVLIKIIEKFMSTSSTENISEVYEQLSKELSSDFNNSLLQSTIQKNKLTYPSENI